MKMPIRGIQVLLVAAFFIHLIAWSFGLVEFFTYSKMLDYDPADKMSFWGTKLSDLAYGVFYLGEAALIEILMRIWDQLRGKSPASN